MRHHRRTPFVSLALIVTALSLLAAASCAPPEDVSSAPTSTARPNRTRTTPSPSATAGEQGAGTPARSGAAPPGDRRVVTNVVDGDTIDVAPVGGTKSERLRLIGVDTPETKDPRKPVQCFGKEASNFTGQLRGFTVTLTYDVERHDKYGRTLAYVWLDDGTFFNLVLAEEGYAQPLTIPPNVAHADEFVAAAARAREARKGLWGSC